ncbi:hypothetical protein CSBG_01022 [Clostridium sp. 7_2_43FAA]|uniref:hypothetical protein n=1 Tax=Clostridium TaxID=1485 RepID=UPI00019AFF99|nr:MULTISPECIES: hypothetical protein [Clostridium]EEH97396.1 hypothetical protein CSBG_01022 [Clostridium sp. 7_2_43FAA]
MGRDEKLYEKIKNNPKSVTFEEIDRLLVNVAGFTKRNGSRASHFFYKHEKLKDINGFVNIPYAKPIKSIYIKKAIKAFEEVMGL